MMYHTLIKTKILFELVRCKIFNNISHTFEAISESNQHTHINDFTYLGIFLGYTGTYSVIIMYTYIF